jgi:hypothetical protein
MPSAISHPDSLSQDNIPYFYFTAALITTLLAAALSCFLLMHVMPIVFAVLAVTAVSGIAGLVAYLMINTFHNDSGITYTAEYEVLDKDLAKQPAVATKTPESETNTPGVATKTPGLSPSHLQNGFTPYSSNSGYFITPESKKSANDGFSDYTEQLEKKNNILHEISNQKVGF